jgi:glycerol kinase
MEKYMLTIDQGTSGTKAILFTRDGQIFARCDAAHEQYYPQPGWVEHDPEEIYAKTLEAIHSLISQSGISTRQIDGLSITNQRETTVVWDRNTGKPVCNAIVWQCRRSSDICEEFKSLGYEDEVKAKTGLVIDAYFSATKIKWILDHIPDTRVKAMAGDLMFGTMDSWLIYNLTGGRVHATDYTNASRTMIFNIHDLTWDSDLLSLFEIPSYMLPKVHSSDEIVGYTEPFGDFDIQIPISGIIGDSQAALFGQNCYEKGMAKATFGTGSSLLMNIGTTYKDSDHGLVTSLAWVVGGKAEYAFEGILHCTGATIKWLVDDLQLIPSPDVTEEIAKDIGQNEGVYLVPAFVGLGAPYWDAKAKAAIIGISRGTKKAHIVRAALESIAYQIKDVLDLMASESGTVLTELRVDGGASKNSFLMQFLADMLNVPVVCPAIEELSALGSAFLAGLALGRYRDLIEIKDLRRTDRIYTSEMSAEERDRLYDGWKSAVIRTLSHEGQ